MLRNATLLRIDTPPGPGEGPTISVRCGAAGPTAVQAASFADLGAVATVVLYVRPDSLPDGVPPTVGGAIRLLLDGHGEQTLSISRVIDRAGTLGHVEVWLAPEGHTSPSPVCGS